MIEQYRCVATTKEGFIQQVVTSYVRNGYYFFVQGRVPEGRDPEAIDRKIVHRYDINLSKGQRFRRKQKGMANLQYIRFGRQWVMLATKGSHKWFAEEGANVRDCRRVPLILEGYSVRVVQGNFILNRDKSETDGPPERDTKLRVRVQISRRAYLDLHADLIGNARRRRADWYAMRFWHIGFEPYAPVRKQLLELLRLVNAHRAARGMTKISPKVIRYKRAIVKPFAPVQSASEFAA